MCKEIDIAKWEVRSLVATEVEYCTKFYLTFFLTTIDPRGDGTGGASIFGLLDAQELNNSDVTKSAKRFIRATSKGAREITKEERKQKGIVTMVEIGG